MLTSNFDIIIAVIIMLLSLFGLIRGFLRELSSIINWFGSFYLASVFKPMIRPIFEDKIQIPFLLDIIANAVLFVLLIIVISIITNYLSIILRKLIPISLNGTLGFLFGLTKGVLLSLLIISFLKVVYNDKSPDFLKDSIIYNSVASDDIFIDMLNNIFGDFSKNRNIKKDINKKIEEIKEDVATDIEKAIDDKIESTTKNLKNNIEDINIIEDINDGIKDVNKDIADNIGEALDGVSDKKDDLLDTKNLDRLINIIVE